MSVSLKELSDAVECEDVERTRELLQGHLSSNPERILSDALIKGASAGSLETVDFILRSSTSVDVNYVDNNGRNALCMAIKSGNIDIVKLLVDNGADVLKERATLNDSDTIPIHVAAQCQSSDILEHLLLKGAHTDSEDKFGCTALLRAIRCENAGNVKTLLEKGAIMKALEGFDTTPLSSAVMVGSPEIVALLLEAGADPTVVIEVQNSKFHKTKCTLLHAGQTVTGESPESSTRILQTLIQAGARVNQVDSSGYTPLQYCILRANDLAFNLENLKLLIKAGGKLQSIHRRGYFKRYSRESSLYLLQCFKLWDAVGLLLEAGWELHREPDINFVLENAQEYDLELYDVIRTLHYHPVPLTHLCRSAIKRHLLECTEDRSIFMRVSNLPLPRGLRDFIHGIK